MGESFRVRFDESESTNVLVSSVDDISTLRDSNTPMDEISLGLNFLVHTFYDYTVNTIKPITTLSLTYLELID